MTGQLSALGEKHAVQTEVAFGGDEHSTRMLNDRSPPLRNFEQVYMAAVKSTASVLYKIDEYGKCKELGFDPQKLSSLPGAVRTSTWRASGSKTAVLGERWFVACTRGSGY